MSRTNVSSAVTNMVIAALLCAIGIIIPLFSPLKIILEPMSFTLASHVPTFLAMFISPVTAIFVSIGTAIGFFMTSPIVIAFRALSHIVFALIGSLILKKYPKYIESFNKTWLFNILMALIHAVCEVLVVVPFYFQNAMGAGYYAKGFMFSVILLVGVGTIVHSMVDFIIAYVIYKPIKRLMKRMAVA